MRGQLLLGALGSCSTIDIISILKKQRQQINRFTIVVQGEREPDVAPSLWKDISITFSLSGELDPDKAKRAADLSMEKYCSVAETLRRAVVETFGSRRVFRRGRWFIIRPK